ncbi:MAG: hypothetical protein LBJ14_00995 [Desulfarculales bacterium]|nr:hypothetical protein [Desulfarculales bacterium]
MLSPGQAVQIHIGYPGFYHLGSPVAALLAEKIQLHGIAYGISDPGRLILRSISRLRFRFGQALVGRGGLHHFGHTAGQGAGGFGERLRPPARVRRGNGNIAG